MGPFKVPALARPAPNTYRLEIPAAATRTWRACGEFSVEPSGLAAVAPTVSAALRPGARLRLSRAAGERSHQELLKFKMRWGRP